MILRAAQYGHCLHHKVLVAYEKFALYRVNWRLCRGLRSSEFTGNCEMRWLAGKDLKKTP